MIHKEGKGVSLNIYLKANMQDEGDEPVVKGTSRSGDRRLRMARTKTRPTAISKTNLKGDVQF